MTLAPRLEQRVTQTQLLYETVGDIELYSLHRIRTQLPTLGVHERTRQFLLRRLLAENAHYREQGRHGKYCVTGEHIENATNETMEFLKNEADLGLATILEEPTRDKVKAFMESKLKEQETKIKAWFTENWDALYYNMDSKLPWPIVQQLRRKLQGWAAGNAGAWYQDIGEFTQEVGNVNGLQFNSETPPEELWDALRELPQY
jgi:hypothetical protein